MDLNGLSDHELVRLRFADLARYGLTLDHSQLAPALAQLHRELAAKKLPFRPFFWISDEWFCPDGVAGIAVPFYLLHPRLLALETRLVGAAEGASHEEAMKLLRHEAGHAFENAYGLRSREERVRLFGDSKTPYPSSYAPQRYSRRYVRHLPNRYAQSHPDEDFAETFAVWLTPRGQWRERYAAWPALEKLRYVDALARELRDEAPSRRGRPVQPLPTIDRTLGEHYARKRRFYRLEPADAVGRALERVFPATERGMTAERYFRTIKGAVRRALASRASYPLYQIDSVLSSLAWRIRSLELRVPTPSRLPRRLLANRILLLSERCLRRGYHRIPV